MNLSALNSATKSRLKTTGISPFMEIELSRVYPNPNQPRKTFQAIDELAASIKENGLIQPIAVVKKAHRYMIISGERRYRACTTLGLKTIKAHIIDADDKKVMELSLVENIQRDDLTDFEKAKFIGQLWSSGHYPTKKALATAIGKSSAYISKAFSALKLDQQIIQDIETDKNDISVSVLDEISRVKEKRLQVEIYQKYLNKEIHRDEIKHFANTPQISRGKKFKWSRKGEFDDIWDDINKQLLHLKVIGVEGKYKITIEEI